MKRTQSQWIALLSESINQILKQEKLWSFCLAQGGYEKVFQFLLGQDLQQEVSTQRVVLEQGKDRHSRYDLAIYSENETDVSKPLMIVEIGSPYLSQGGKGEIEKPLRDLNKRVEHYKCEHVFSLMLTAESLSDSLDMSWGKRYVGMTSKQDIDSLRSKWKAFGLHIEKACSSQNFKHHRLHITLLSKGSLSACD